MECIIPQICGGIKEEVSKLLSGDEPVVSLTTHNWSCSSNDTSSLSLIAHWIDKSFTKVSAVLHTQTQEMAHTGELYGRKNFFYARKLGYLTGKCSLSDQ